MLSKRPFAKSSSASVARWYAKKPSAAATAARPVTKSKRPYKTDFEVLKAFSGFFLLEEALLRVVSLLVLQRKPSFDFDMLIPALPFWFAILEGTRR
jgi:hypothetical protein